jgi:hypothetical protein
VCLAVMCALDTIKYYLLGRKSTLITDHAPPSVDGKK